MVGHTEHLASDNVAERLPTGWRPESDDRYLGPQGARNEVLLVLNEVSLDLPDKGRYHGWSYNLDVTPVGTEALRMYNGAFKDAQAGASLEALAEVPEVALDALPDLFTTRGLRISWFKGQEGREVYLPQQL